jgi:hypothetical protein
MNGSAATAPAKYASLSFLLNESLDVVHIGRLPVCLIKKRCAQPAQTLTKF